MFNSRLQLLIGGEKCRVLQDATVLICGLGGVGSWAAEMLARNGVGTIILADFDIVKESNINRQLVALHSTVGEEKGIVMARRIQDINPECQVVVRNCHLTAGNVIQFLEENPCEAVIDAIDERPAKLALLEACVKREQFVISSMGAAGRVFPDKITVGDLSETLGCPVAKLMRKNLKKVGIAKGIRCVYSPELPVISAEEDMTAAPGERRALGTLSTTTAIFGIRCAHEVLDHLVGLSSLPHLGE